MKILKKTTLILVTLLLCLMNIGVVFADDEQETADPASSYSAYYEFVLNGEGELPEEILSLLPETKTGLKDGDVITNQSYEEVKVNEDTYNFMGWDKPMEYTIEGSDVTFTGTWTKNLLDPFANESENSNQNQSNESSNQNQNPSSNANTYRVDFEFLNWGTFSSNGLPQEVMNLLPASVDVEVGKEPDLPTYELTASYQFKGWDKAQRFDDAGKIYTTYFGLWEKLKFRVIPTPSNPGYGGGSQISTGGALGIPGLATPSFSLNGRQTYCYTPNIHGYASSGTTYWRGGTYGDADSSPSERVANVIITGQRRGADHKTIQLAVWDAVGHGGYGVSWRDYYDEGIEAWGEVWETYSPASGPMQDVVYATGYRELNPKANVKKVSSDPNYDYGSYPNNYSLAGAVYGLYSDPACTNQVGTFTTNSSGNSNTIEFNDEGTYYVKEITASKGFMLDPTVHTARVRKGQTTTITSQEDPYYDPIRIVLYKQNAKDKTHVKYLDEAEFTVRYYDALDENIEGLSPKKTWVFKPTFNALGEAEVILDQEHYVRGDSLPLDVSGYFYLPLGTFTIQETKAPQTYQIDPNVYVGRIYRENDETITVINGGEWLEVENESLTQSEREVILSTTAIFEENGEHRYVADGVAHIVDVVEYDWLIPGTYYKVVGKLMQVEVTETKYTQEEFDAYVEENGEDPEWKVDDVKERTKTEKAELMTAETVFTPEAETGTVSVRFDGIDFDDKENTDYVVYEYLYVLETEDPVIDPTDPDYDPDAPVEPVITGEELITYHEDIYDEGQSVHVDPLYRAAFVLYKISEGNRNNKLSGAYFTVTTKRTKRDGRVIEKDLGTYVTGGIYIPLEEGENPDDVTIELYTDPKPTIDPDTGQEIPPTSDEPVFMKKYQAKYNEQTKKNAVTILGLEDGIYYTQRQGEDKRTTWYISKGTIYLPEQEEDTLITFTEIVAPVGYVRDTKPFTMTVGHNYTVEKVENYRSNFFPYVPVTGRD